MTAHRMSTGTRRPPTDVAGLTADGSHAAMITDDGELRRASVRAWSVDGRPMYYSAQVGRLVPWDAAGWEFHGPDDELFGCERCQGLRLRARRALTAVDS